MNNKVGNNNLGADASASSPGAVGSAQSRDRHSSVFKINYNMDGNGMNNKRDEDVDPSSNFTKPRNDSSDVFLDKIHPPNFNVNRRTSVSAEIISPDSHTENLDLNLTGNGDGSGNALSNHESEALIKCLDSNFLFKNLDPQAKNLIIQNLRYQEFPANTDIIVEGDEEGEYFYIIETGTVEYLKGGKKLGEGLKGATFGELALMYNSPRQATVRSKTFCKMYLLDRITFKKILLNNSYVQRNLYDKFLKNLPILSNLTESERNKLIDVLKIKTVPKGSVIIRQGEMGENFYIIEQGSCVVIKDNVELKALHKNDYFGELALLDDSPRAATVVASSEEGCKLVYLGKSEFKRLLGPVHEVLKLNDPRLQ
ncbi:camp-dependent protein kinase regulatory subunit [Hanseniaspora valbyensis NRRL Y-1626]|uniref:cAMP-dependent protein kinase regulatory subunit n=1 Tax=Hanseniaspora valbyensis NRRL Y-1626 TaxID=766949 RepID=A0A1B7TAI8_9ASCO|nr:camp-dependent protein kinase regulatory subunit [Hanseniaspora valbyensis NRRL Y-1626]